MTKISTPTYIPEIQALRGLCALTVALFHSFIWLKVENFDFQWLPPLRSDMPVIVQLWRCGLVLLNGHGAVLVFFVLSGLVLGMAFERQLIRDEGMRLHILYRHYVRQRIMRIFPTHILIVTLAAFFFLVFSPIDITHPAVGEWFTFWHSAANPTFGVYIANLLLFSPTLNQVSWSLFHEIYGCLALPKLYLRTRQVPEYMFWLGLPILFLSSIFPIMIFPFAWVLDHNPLQYLFLFIAGLVIACRRDFLGTRWIKFWMPWALLPCLGLPRLLMDNHYFNILACEGMIAILIVYVWQAPINIASPARWMRITWLMKLGDYSLSFYLAHAPLLIVCGALFIYMLPAWFLLQYPLVVMAISAVISIDMTWLVCRKWLYPFERYWIRK